LAIATALGTSSQVGMLLGNLGYSNGRQGHYDKALDYCQQSLDISQTVGNRNVELVALIHLGEFAVAQALWSQAEAYYQQAATINKELNQPHFMVEGWAGLGLVALRQGDLTLARAYADQLLDAWHDDPTFESVDNSMRVLHFTWQLCQGLGLAAADGVLAAAAQVIQAYLDDFPDPETQATYLRQPHHQALWTAVQAGK